MPVIDTKAALALSFSVQQQYTRVPVACTGANLHLTELGTTKNAFFTTLVNDNDYGKGYTTVWSWKPKEVLHHNPVQIK